MKRTTQPPTTRAELRALVGKDRANEVARRWRPLLATFIDHSCIPGPTLLGSTPVATWHARTAAEQAAFIIARYLGAWHQNERAAARFVAGALSEARRPVDSARRRNPRYSIACWHCAAFTPAPRGPKPARYITCDGCAGRSSLPRRRKA